MLNIPQAFYLFGFWMNQAAPLLYGRTPEEMVAGALSRIDEDQRPALRAFVDQLLTGPYSEADLQKVYSNAEADIGPRGQDGARKMFSLIRATLDAGCVPFYGPL